MGYTKNDAVALVKEQLAIELNCRAGDFDKTKNLLTEPVNDARKRHFIEGPYFFKMATFGMNAAVSADARMHPWLARHIQGVSGHTLFEHTSLMKAEEQLQTFGKSLWQTHIMYLSDMIKAEVKPLCQVKWFEGGEITPLYEGGKYPNALCKEYLPKRPDVLAVGAFEGGEMVALAGCSADTPLLFQIGIDVRADKREQGIGTYLVSLLKNEIISRGKIPCYGTSVSNLFSWRIALKTGFYPAWVETESLEGR